MKLIKPKNHYTATTIPELLDMAESVDGQIYFRDDKGRNWQLRKVDDVVIYSPTKEGERDD